MAIARGPGRSAQHALQLSAPERAYLGRRLNALEAAAAGLRERAALVGEPEASLLLCRAAKRRARAARIRRYLRTAESPSMPAPLRSAERREPPRDPATRFAAES